MVKLRIPLSLRNCRHLRGRMPVVSAAVVVAVSATACAAGAKGPVAAAADFVADFARHDVHAAAGLTNQPDEAAAALASAWDNLGARTMSANTGSARVSGDTATVDYTYEWHLAKNRVWTYAGQLQMGRVDGGWQVRWTASDIHPQLGDTQTMALRETPAPRARVNERSGTDVLIPGVVHRITFTLAQATDPGYTTGVLGAALHRFDDTITANGIVAAARKAGGAYTVALLTETEFNQVSGDLLGLPGVTTAKEWDMVPTDRGFAPDLIAQVHKTVIDEVDGKDGWDVVTVNANGVDTDVLKEVAPQPVPSFALSLDRTVQNAAQQAVDGRPDKAVMVVVQPSTGAILAVAQNEPADADGPIATSGLYPPGSTFKTVTAAAAMSSGIATPDTVLPCPGRIVVGERTIPNYDGFSLGDVPMSRAYARSCNTSFAKLASELSGDALTIAATKFGVGPDYSIAGLTTVSGSVPPANDLTQRTENGIGQGRVLVSPFGMALVAATVAHGSAPVPYLLSGHPTTVSAQRPAPSPKVIAGLRLMMRQVVLNGTAVHIADQGEVYGKTGEAEVAGGSHSWFIGYRGDMAWATMLVDGGSSDNAVAVTRDMLAALPPGIA
ncbi:penicillin-binding transpeptidase domain-containing protein [Nocardia miyunensis]|uniref:penicillin-binding transpeptidase domain-containing protein n=1 Tax=Nocardia miyunensis TaxID=282684 RepID=UPI000AED0CAF|nr:penicillin-binding transpeptidase domain-containing protein [Nocardia miyunensis]